MLTPAPLAAALVLAASSALAAGGTAPDPRTAAVAGVHAAQERLRDEMAVMRGIAAAQDLLARWNALRARAGEPPAALPAALCDRPGIAAWCRVLPATFGGPR